jgi:uncharacterized protein (UPF0276 family)
MQTAPLLGVGLAYQAPFRRFIESARQEFDFIEIVPDIFWTDNGPGAAERYTEDDAGVSLLRQLRTERTVIPHSIGLSIGSAHRFDREHIEQIRRWSDWLEFPWHSDHLAFHLAEHGGIELNVGITAPLPRDDETLELLTPRVREVLARVPAPFLLENNVYYFDVPEAEYDEPTFLNLLCRRSGCGLLLDLHNVYVNSRNHGMEPRAFLERLDLENVLELHVAGGMELDGFYLDAHSGPVPAPVIELLDWILPQCANVGGVVFELFGSWFAEVGEAGLKRELEGLQSIWHRRVRRSSGKAV